MLLRVLVVVALLCAAVAQENSKRESKKFKPESCRRPFKVAPEDRHWIDKAEIASKEYAALDAVANWGEPETVDELTGIKVYAFNTTLSDGKEWTVLKAEIETDYPPEPYYMAVNTKIETMPDWNSIVPDTKLLKCAGSRTKIVWQRLKPQAPLDLAFRDFVVLYRSNMYRRNGAFAYEVILQSIENFTDSRIPPIAPPIELGKIGLSAVTAERNPKDPKKTLISWVVALKLNYDLDPPVLALYTRFNIILYMDNLLKHVDDMCRKSKSRCLTRPTTLTRRPSITSKRRD